MRNGAVPVGLGLLALGMLPGTTFVTLSSHRGHSLVERRAAALKNREVADDQPTEFGSVAGPSTNDHPRHLLKTGQAFAAARDATPYLLGLLLFGVDWYYALVLASAVAAWRGTVAWGESAIQVAGIVLLLLGIAVNFAIMPMGVPYMP